MKQFHRIYLFVALLLAGTFTLSVAVGSVFIPPAEVLSMLLGNADEVPNAALYSAILFKVRLPHTILILLTGAALSGSGAAYQGLFRNPLADPYLIGVASGAGLGAVFAMSANWPDSLLGFYAIPVAAFLGSTLTVFLVYQLSRVGKTVPATTMILAGVAISSFASALTSFLMLRSTTELRRALSWLMGGGTMGGWDPVMAIFPYIALGLGVLIISGHMLNVLQFGDEQAHSLGLHVERTKLWLILAASLATAAAVSFSGIIGFIGLIVPHVVRLLWGADYRHAIPLSILGGASILLAADTLARVVLAPQVLPVGIITALAGAPFFLWLLKNARNQAFG
jgi:iron complex transport system permease protein